LPEVVLVEFAEVHSVELNGAVGGVVETWDKVGEGGLAGTAGTDKGNAFASLDGNINAGKDGLVILVGEVYVLKFDFSADKGEGLGLLGFGDVVIAVKDVFEAVEGGFGFAEGVVNGAKFLDGLVTHVEGGEDSGDGGGFDLANDEVEAESDGEGCNNFDEGGKRLVVFDGLEGEFEEVTAGLLEAVGLAFLEVVGADFADGLEVFVEDVVEETGLFLGGVGFAEESFADVFDGEDATRDGGEGNKHEDGVFVLEGEVDEDAKGAEEGGGFLDKAVDDVDNSAL
jgi:hypothetical protein